MNDVKVVFLDIDGVLNGYSKIIFKVEDILRKLHFIKFYHMVYDIFGVRTYKVYLLSKILKKTGAKVVLSSSWRGGWDVPFEENNSRMKSLKRKFKWFHENWDVIDEKS